ncbi:hypothetical protein BGZ51_004117 [Haplosporangium sp. Z 767]|nr:hypothetical protein BGZ51_004117 [Haplosporangium sp. Z 767]
MGSNRPSARNQRAKLAADLNDLFKDLQSNQVKTVGNYHLGDVIGQGTYGKVKLATHALTGQQVAIKIVAKAHAAIITREIYHWRCLSHANIAHLHEVLTTESKIYLVTEYCPKGELLEALIRDGRCKPALAKRWFRQICLAIQYCHAKKIVHRDLKLENILLDSQDNIKLIDFGFTRECESKKLLESYCGSAAYTAPEIIVGKKYSGPEADIWSLGVILYTLLAGYLPFDDDNESVVQDKIVELDYELPNELFCKDSQDLIRGILKEDPKERLSIEHILGHSWWTSGSEGDEECAEMDSKNSQEQDMDAGATNHGRQGSLTKREIHPVNSSQNPGDIVYSGSPQLASPLAQYPYTWGGQSPYAFNPASDGLRAAFPGGPLIPSPLSSPLPSPSPMVNKSFPRHESGLENGQGSRSPAAGAFPSNTFEQRLLNALQKIGFDQDIFYKGIPSQSCDPAYGLWCLLVDQVRQRALDNGTTLEWEQSIALMEVPAFTGAMTPGGINNGSFVMTENGKRSPRPMSDPSPSSSQTNLLLPHVTLIQQQNQQQQQQQQQSNLQQQTLELKEQLDQYKLETELLKVEKEQLEKEKRRLEELRDQHVTHFYDRKELPSVVVQTDTEHATSGSKPEHAVQDSGVSVSTSSTPHSSWELTEREGPVIPPERPRRKSKGILHSIKDRFFHSTSSDGEVHSSPYPPSPIPPKHFAGSTASASSSSSSATTYVTSMTPKPLPAPPAHPYPHMLQQPTVHSPLSAVSYKSASTSSLAMDTGHAIPTLTDSAAAVPTAALTEGIRAGEHTVDSEIASSPPKRGGFMTWITESASGTVLNKSPVVQSTAKVPTRLNTKSFTSPEPFSTSYMDLKRSTSSSEEARPQIPAIPASFFQPVWKPSGAHGSSSTSSPANAASASVMATSAPSMSIRQRLASFSNSTAKITPEERQRVAAAAAAAAALVAQPTLPERAHSPSPPSSPRGSGGNNTFGTLASTVQQKGDRQQQNEISDIVAAAVAATTSANLKSSGSRKKSSGLYGSSTKKAKAEKSGKNVSSGDNGSSNGSVQSSIGHPRRPSESTPWRPSVPSLQIPTAPVNGSLAKEAPLVSSKDIGRKPSIKASKTAMPSLMTAFSPFKPSKSAPSSPLVHQSVQSFRQNEPLPESKAHPSQQKVLKEQKVSKSSKGSRHDEPSYLSRVMSNSSSRSTAAMTPNSTTQVATTDTKSKDLTQADPMPAKAFDDGVVVQEEVVRTKKRTTSRTSITAASLSRKSSDSAASSTHRSEPSSPHTTATIAVHPSKRTSLGSLSSRRSSNGSIRDRNIFGLTLDGTGSGSRKSSLNLSRTPLSKSTFQSPASVSPRRGIDMDRDSRVSHEDGRPNPRVDVVVTDDMAKVLVDARDGTPILRPKNSLEGRYDGGQKMQCDQRQSDSRRLSSQGTAVSISPSLSTSSSLTRIATADSEEKPQPIAIQGASKAAVATKEDEDPVSDSDAPRVDFTDGCSLIPSPPPSPAPIRRGSGRTSGSALANETNHLTERKQSTLEEPKVTLLSTSYPPPRTSLSYTPSESTMGDSDALGAHQDSMSPPSPSRPLVSFDQHFSNQVKIREYRDGTPRKVVNGFQPLAAKRLSKPGLPNSSSTTTSGVSTGDSVPALPGRQGSSSVSFPQEANALSAANGPPNAFAGRRRGYRNSTGSMANMTLQQQQNFQQLQREQLMRIQQNQPNAGYEATAAMKLHPRPRTGMFPKREYGGVSLGGVNSGFGHGNSGSGLGGFEPSYEGGSAGAGGVGAKRDSYSNRRQSMAVAMGKRGGAAPAAIQEEEE